MIGQAARVAELQRLKHKKEPVDSHKIITFTSGKGGTGKTFSVVNIAYSLAKLGAKVLLVDFDANLSNINIIMDYHPQATLSAFFQKRSFFEEIITNCQKNLDIVFGDSGKAEYPDVNETLVNDLMRGIERVEGKYDFVLIDTASGAGTGLISLLSKSHINLIVTTPEPTSVMDAYVIVKLLKVNGYNGEKYVLFNKCVSPESGEIGYNNLINACKHFLGENVNLLGTISYNQEVMQSIIDQKLLVETSPFSQVSEEIKEISARILKFKQMANIRHAVIK